MFRTSWFVAGIVGLGTLSAQASTFTPDMWVYELTVEPVSFNERLRGAWTTGPAGTTVPAGCDWSSMAEFPGTPSDNGDIRIECGSVDPNILGIDVLADPGFARFNSIFRIGFNRTGFACEDVIGGVSDVPNPTLCPPPNFDPFPPVMYNDVLIDYAKGTASYSFSIVYYGDAIYDLSRERATMSSLFVSSTAGFWDHGYGGSWYTYSDALFTLAGSGTLISSPTVVPLPAPALMLLSALAAFVPGIVRRRTRKRLEGSNPV